VTDFLHEKYKEITAQLDELKPLVDEFNRLEDAALALAKVIGSAASEATSAVAATVTHRRKRGRPRRSGSAKRASKATPAAAAAATPAATPVQAPRKKRGRPPGRKKVGRPPGSGAKAAASTAAPAAAAPPRAGRRKGSGKRSKQALRLVRKQPGITIPELAAEMKISSNYLYRILPGLEREGKIRKEGRGWYPVEG
jgi:hypothetical protein